MALTDLKYEIPFRYAPASKQEDIANVHRQTHLSSDNGLSSYSYISTLCSKIPRQPQDQILQMSRSIHCMAFAQLTYRESLRDIEACLRAQRKKLYHMGIRSNVSLNTMSIANKVLEWRIYADFAQSLKGS